MQILLAIIIGVAVGLALEFVVPHRSLRGVAVAPIVGAVSAALVWTIMTWAGVGLDNPFIWLAAIVTPIVVTWPTLLLLTRLRLEGDEKERVRLKIS